MPVNITAMVAAMGRLVISDSNSVRVCSLDGLALAVPDLPEPDGRGGLRPVWKDRVAGPLDNARIMWDGSFLWVAELQLRVTQENQVALRRPSKSAPVQRVRIDWSICPMSAVVIATLAPFNPSDKQYSTALLRMLLLHRLAVDGVLSINFLQYLGVLVRIEQR